MPDLTDNAVVSVLVKNHQAFLGFLTRRLGNKADAEDVLQEFCLKALLGKDQLREADSLVSWLYKLLRTTLIDHYRKTNRQGRIYQAYSEELKIVGDIDEADDLHANLCACLHALLPTLRADQAELVRRIDLGEEERTMLATELGISPGTLAVRLHRARQALRNALLVACASCTTHGFDDCACQSDKRLSLDAIANSGLAEGSVAS